MKLNPVGISSYQQLGGREATRQAQAESSNQDAGKSQATVAIAPQSESQSSRLAVKIQGGSYADYLSPEEKNALELLFNRFNDKSRFGPSYGRTSSASDGESAHLGNLVDVKV
jgi:hypothetical protein